MDRNRTASDRLRDLAMGKGENAIIVINDDDFYHFSNLYGFPPKVVLLRTGNQYTNSLAEILIKHSKDIHQLFEDNETGLLEIFDIQL